MDLSYTGDIKGYLDELAEVGYLTAEYATDRHIYIVGGTWDYDEGVLAQANPDVYGQRPLLPFD